MSWTTELKIKFDQFDKSKYPDPYTYYLNPHCVFRQYVYAFYNPLSRLTKIGITQDPWIRLNQLSTQNGVKLIHIIHSYMDSHFDPHPLAVEGFLHYEFKDKRTHGEWFNLDFNDITNIVYFLGCDHELDIEVEYDQIGEDYVESTGWKIEFLENFKTLFYELDNNIPQP